ncbi:hypothetical protein EPUL_002570 [Erysiphe pulchra]|uniref:Uncharacterized protein n=1 Tax=Erysiphe pulchra TaxID=225359 RepID=A0A2S4PPY5_9PEZI|nr:hypothetical protein EPUL_002570 [Erysiphe pulchra]
MSDLPKEVTDVLGDLAKATNATQFLNGVRNNPELVFEVVKTLAQQKKAYKRKLEKEQQLLISSKESEAAKEGLRELEKSSETNIITTSSSKVSSYSQWHSIHWEQEVVPNLEGGNSFKIKVKYRPLPHRSIKDGLRLPVPLHGFIKDGVINFESLDQMMNELIVLFDDPNRDAIARLHANSPRNKPFSSWIAEIRRDAAIAGYESSRELRNIVFLNLSLEFQQALIYERDIYSLVFNEAVVLL